MIKASPRQVKLDRPVVAPVRREKQPTRAAAPGSPIGTGHQPNKPDHQRDAEDPVAEAPWPVRGEDKCRYHVNVVVRPS